MAPLVILLFIKKSIDTHAHVYAHAHSRAHMQTHTGLRKKNAIGYFSIWFVLSLYNPKGIKGYNLSNERDTNWV